MARVQNIQKMLDNITMARNLDGEVKLIIHSTQGEIPGKIIIAKHQSSKNFLQDVRQIAFRGMIDDYEKAGEAIEYKFEGYTISIEKQGGGT